MIKEKIKGYKAGAFKTNVDYKDIRRRVLVTVI
jgi:hypothetical protein